MFNQPNKNKVYIYFIFLIKTVVNLLMSIKIKKYFFLFKTNSVFRKPYFPNQWL